MRQAEGLHAGRVLAWKAEAQASLKLGWPLILTNLAQVALLTTDIIFMGRLGADALAAGSLSVSLYHTFMIFSMGLVSATIPMLATTLGKRRNALREIRRTVRQGLWTAALICIPAWAILWHTEAILVFMGQSPPLAAKAAQFMHTLQWALLPYLAYIVLRSFLAAIEKPVWTLVIAAGAIAFNALAGWLLIFGHWGFPALGLEGAGIASTCSSTMMFLGLALVLTRHKQFRRYRLLGRLWDRDWARLAELWRLGIPIAITFTLETLVFYSAVMMMGIIGKDALAAHAIAMQLATITFMVPLGFGQVATIRVGLAAGRADPYAIRRAGWTAFGLGVGFMGLAAMLMWLAPRMLIGFFLDASLPSNQAVAALAVRFLAVAALFQLADGAQAVCAGMLRGLHDTRVPMLFAILGYWILGVPCGAFLAFVAGWEGVGVWLGLATGLTVVAVLMTSRWLKRSRIEPE
ncbi:MATE family efflux transporter [Pollutimonas bauzanensis]|uniref:Multidrug-efflux transporter n=1 Tax=Pollutimonas bauzanensis TaxID=658167 RepID=A0A1M5ZID4_9BURK|nr:MATE family efflux transporter [Pollutimonas bauzanensis]SHI23972.1 multidrug resistance protein, MATE family [Pollutimonas bauzanensis]